MQRPSGLVLLPLCLLALDARAAAPADLPVHLDTFVDGKLTDTVRLGSSNEIPLGEDCTVRRSAGGRTIECVVASRDGHDGHGCARDAMPAPRLPLVSVSVSTKEPEVQSLGFQEEDRTLVYVLRSGAAQASTPGPGGARFLYRAWTREQPSPKREEVEEETMLEGGCRVLRGGFLTCSLGARTVFVRAMCARSEHEARLLVSSKTREPLGLAIACTPPGSALDAGGELDLGF